MIQLTRALWAKLAYLTVASLVLSVPGVAQADPLNKAKVTQTVNDVKISNAQGGNVRSASPGMNFAIPELLRTGANSRAELIAPDKTVTRVGSNTVFSFKQGKRGVNLQQGSVLFHSPTGKGGGEVQTASATASVLGTTIIVAATSNGGFKFMVLEGLGQVIMPNGNTRKIEAGNLTFIMPGANNTPQVFEFRLSAQTSQSLLIQGFNNEGGPVQSFLSKVEAQTQQQEEEISEGDKEGTNLKVGDAVGDDIEIVDAGTQTAFFDELVAQTLSEGTPVDIPVAPRANPFNPETEPQAYDAFDGFYDPATINTNTLDETRVVYFDDPAELELFLTTIGISEGGYYLEDASVMTASTMVFDTPNLDLSDQQPGDFAFLAYSTMTFNQLLEVENVPGNFLGFAAYGAIAFANGSGVIANVPEFEFLSQGIIGGTDLTFANYGGGIQFFGESGIFFNQTDFSYSRDDYGAISMYSMGPIEIFDSLFYSTSESSTPGGVYFDTTGSIYIENTSIDDMYSYVNIGYYDYGYEETDTIYNKVDLELDTEVVVNAVASSGDYNTDSITLIDTYINAADIYASAAGDILIEGTGGDSISSHRAEYYYSVTSGEGKVTIRKHDISSGQINILAEHDLVLDDVNYSKVDDAVYGGGDFTSLMGNVNIDGGDHGTYAAGVGNGPMTYYYNAQNGNITVNGSGAKMTNFGDTDTTNPSQFNFYASNTVGEISMRNATFLANVSNVNMDARTISLQDVTFSANTVANFWTETGNVNFGSVMPGHLNLVNNVRHLRETDPTKQDLSNPTNYNNFQESHSGYFNSYSNGGGPPAINVNSQ